MSREVVEKAIIVGALPIFKAFELNVSGLLFFGFVDFLPSVRDVERIDRIDDEELESPDDIGSVLDVTGFFEALEGNGLCIVIAVETADDDKSGVGVALKFFKLANRVVDAKFRRIFGGRNDLKIVETDYGSFSFVVAEGFEKSKELIDRFVLEFENTEIKFGFSEVVNDIVELYRVSPAANVSGS